MKKVLDPQTVAHYFANQVQSEATNSGRTFYYEGNELFSYGRHFCIAKHVKNEAGENGTLFTLRSYSNTTRKHISIALHALSHKNLIFVPDPANSSAGNFEAWQRQAESEAKQLTTCRKPEKYLSEISRIANQVNTYATFFGYTVPEALQAVLNIGNKEQYQQFAAKKEAYKLAEEKRQAKENKKLHKKQLQEFINFERNTLYVRNGFDYLRLSFDGLQVETTQGVKMPVDYAAKLYNRIASNEIKPGDKVLQFEVIEVTKQTIKIGCHNFEIKYLLSFGAQLLQKIAA